MRKELKRFYELCGIEPSPYNIIEIKHFHPSGKMNCPNGSPYQKGGWYKECNDNEKSFIIKEGIKYNLTNDGNYINEELHPEQYGLFDYSGGLIVFAVSINAIRLHNNAIINTIQNNKKIDKTVNQFNKEKGYIGAFSVGNFFRGKYIADNGKIFNDKSLSVEIDGIDNEGLHMFAEMLANDFKQETVLVKNFNKNKIYLVNGKPSDGNYDLSHINTKVEK